MRPTKNWRYGKNYQKRTDAKIDELKMEIKELKSMLANDLLQKKSSTSKHKAKSKLLLQKNSYSNQPKVRKQGFTCKNSTKNLGYYSTKSYPKKNTRGRNHSVNVIIRHKPLFSKLKPIK